MLKIVDRFIIYKNKITELTKSPTIKTILFEQTMVNPHTVMLFCDEKVISKYS